MPVLDVEFPDEYLEEFVDKSFWADSGDEEVDEWAAEVAEECLQVTGKYPDEYPFEYPQWMHVQPGTP